MPNPPFEQRVDGLLGLARDLLQAEDQHQVLDVAVEGTMKVVGADRGFLVLAGPPAPSYRVVRNWDVELAAREGDRVSSTIVQEVIRSAAPLFVRDALVDQRFSDSQSVVDLIVRSVMAAPFRLSTESHGVLYLERNDGCVHFSDDDFDAFLEALELCGRQIEHGIRTYDVLRPEQVDRQPIPGFELDGLLPQNPAFLLQLEIAAKAARRDVSILVQGPSGTGKELIATAIHRASARNHGPFRVLNCGAVSEELVRSELFGHERGAFTGALSRREGLLTSADGGTVFLDEVGELPLGIQPVLLRTLQSGEVQTVGRDSPSTVDVRLISATNVDLEKHVAAGLFREDLYFRINTITIDVPPLRRRREDILPLFDYLVEKLDDGAPARRSRDLEEALLRYDWPGNVRQLENEVQRLLAIRDSPKSTLRKRDLSPRILEALDREPPKTLDESQRELVVDHLRYAGGNKTKAAGTLGISREGLRKMLERFDIDESEWSPPPT